MTRVLLGKTNAHRAMGANRAAEQRDKELLVRNELARDSAQRIVELTELVADLTARVEALEGGA